MAQHRPTIKEDEIFKAAAHGLFAGCMMPVLAYNIHAKRWGNVAIYVAILGFEALNIVSHLRNER